MFGIQIPSVHCFPTICDNTPRVRTEKYSYCCPTICDKSVRSQFTKKFKPSLQLSNLL